MQQYLDTLKKIMTEGVLTDDRTGVGRIRIFGTQQRYNLKDGFPLVTTRKIFTRGMIEELLWFIRGSANNNELKDKNVNIWNHWAVAEEDVVKFLQKYHGVTDPEQVKSIVSGEANAVLGSIGPMYGAMWRNAPRGPVSPVAPKPTLADIPSDKLKSYKEFFAKYGDNPLDEQGNVVTFEDFAVTNYMQTVDQLQELVIGLKRDPYGSRHVVTAWIPEFVPIPGIGPQENVILGRGALAPCHAIFQCFALPPEVEGDKPRLSLQMMQRSVDETIGKPYNIAQYSLLLAMLAHVTDMEAYEFIHIGGDSHIYKNHLEKYNPELKEGVETQLTREPLTLPTLWLNPEVKDLFAFTVDDIKILDYQHHSDIKYPIAV